MTTDLDPRPTSDSASRTSLPLPRPGRRLRWKLHVPVVSDWRIGISIAAGVAATWGVVAGLWTPRGPVTTGQALGSVAISLVVGLSAGFVSRSRWSLLAGPVAFAMLFELVRTGTTGPTVEGFRASGYGILAVIAGRGFHALVSLFPLAWGATIGAGWARRALGGVVAARSLPRRIAVLVAGLVLAVVCAGLARPASTDPILDATGEPLPGSVAELVSVDINGHELAMMIRGHSIDNPVLLFLAGGPGGSELGSMRRHLSELEEYFTVVTWDQRGTGKSYAEIDPVSTLTLDGAVADTIAVTDYLRERFGQDQIYLAGQSWGTTLGVLAIQEHPEFYRAFIGTGQMVSQRATDVIFYEDTVAWAMQTGRTDLFTDLVAAGPPPYDEVIRYEDAMSHEQEMYRYDHSRNSEGEGQMSENLFVSEYTLLDQVHILAGFLDTFSVLYPQLQEIDFRQTATSFEVPMFFVQGAHEAPGRADLFNEWYPMITAPRKELVVFETSGHRPLWEQPDEFVRFMTDTVLPLTES